MSDGVIYEGMVGKLHDGCLGVVVEKTVFFSLVLLVNALKNILVDGFCFDSCWGLKQGIVDMLFLNIRYIFKLYKIRMLNKQINK